MAAHRRLVLAGPIVVLVLTLLAGSAVRPVTVRSEVQPMTYCRWAWDGGFLLWCYRCCDVYGCYYMGCNW